MENLELIELYIYPIKSLGGIELGSAEIEETGLRFDRKWMLVDKDNQFITQRKFSTLALLRVRIENDEIVVHAPDEKENFRFHSNDNNGNKSMVTVWDDTCEAVEVSKLGDEFFSDYLGIKCKLVYMPSSSRRLVDKKYAQNEEIVGFADGFPFLLIGDASLTDLNNRLEQAVGINRFRPNFVVNTTTPFDEDWWNDFTIGGALFKAVKPCARCVLTTVEPATGLRGAEPLKTLASYRNFNNKVLFGQNLLFAGGQKSVKVGDKIIVRNRKN